MTTSYKLDAIKQLRAQKKLERELEAVAAEKNRKEKEAAHQANMDRIARKMHEIETGEELPAPEVKETPKPKPVKEKTDATSKRQKPKNDKLKHKQAKKRGPKPKASSSNRSK